MKTGYVLIVNGTQLQALHDNVMMHHRIGISTEELSPAEAMDAAPALWIDEDESCVYEPYSGYADSFSVKLGLLESSDATSGVNRNRCTCRGY